MQLPPAGAPCQPGFSQGMQHRAAPTAVLRIPLRLPLPPRQLPSHQQQHQGLIRQERCPLTASQQRLLWWPRRLMGQPREASAAPLQQHLQEPALLCPARVPRAAWPRGAPCPLLLWAPRGGTSSTSCRLIRTLGTAGAESPQPVRQLCSPSCAALPTAASCILLHMSHGYRTRLAVSDTYRVEHGVLRQSRLELGHSQSTRCFPMSTRHLLGHGSQPCWQLGAPMTLSE